MTRKEFSEVLRDLSPVVYDGMLAGGMSLPKIAQAVALDCFLYRSGEVDSIMQRTLRGYLQNLDKTGVFGFDKE